MKRTFIFLLSLTGFSCHSKSNQQVGAQVAAEEARNITIDVKVDNGQFLFWVTQPLSNLTNQNGELEVNIQAKDKNWLLVSDYVQSERKIYWVERTQDQQTTGGTNDKPVPLSTAPSNPAALIFPGNIQTAEYSFSVKPIDLKEEEIAALLKDKKKILDFFVVKISPRLRLEQNGQNANLRRKIEVIVNLYDSSKKPVVAQN